MARSNNETPKTRTPRWLAALLAAGLVLGAVATAQAGDRPSRGAKKSAARSRTNEKSPAVKRAARGRTTQARGIDRTDRPRTSSDRSKAGTQRGQIRARHERSGSSIRADGVRDDVRPTRDTRVVNTSRASKPRKSSNVRSLRSRTAPATMKAPGDKSRANGNRRGRMWNGKDELKYGIQVPRPQGGLGTETQPEVARHQGRDPLQEIADANNGRGTSGVGVGAGSGATNTWIEQGRDMAENGSSRDIQSDLNPGGSAVVSDNGGPLGDLPEFVMPDYPAIAGQGTKPGGQANPLAPEGGNQGGVPDSGKYVSDKKGEEAPTDAGGTTEPRTTMAERKSLWTRFKSFVTDWSVGVGTDPVPVPAGTALAGPALIESVTGDAADGLRGLEGNKRGGETGTVNKEAAKQLAIIEREFNRNPEGHVDSAKAKAMRDKQEKATHYMAIKLAARKGSLVNPTDDAGSAASGPALSAADKEQRVKDLTVRGGRKATGLTAAEIANKAKLQSAQSSTGMGVINPGSEGSSGDGEAPVQVEQPSQGGGGNPAAK